MDYKAVKNISFVLSLGVTAKPFWIIKIVKSLIAIGMVMPENWRSVLS